MLYNGTEYYYLKNIQGDIIGILDGSGTSVVEYSYDSWGKVIEISGNQELGKRNPFRYRGYYYDEETGFYYVSSRYYDPEVGRFISPDTTDILGADSDLYDKNLYAYCDNNPVMRKDSSGELWIAAVAAGVTALIPGSGIGGSLIRNITSEAIISVERHVTGKSNNLRSSVTNVVVGTLIDTRVESVTNRVTKYVRTKTSATYSQEANTMRQKNPNVSTNTIRTSAQRSVRWGNRLAKGIEFVFNSIRSALPW